jgi:hypothetical protein
MPIDRYAHLTGQSQGLGGRLQLEAAGVASIGLRHRRRIVLNCFSSGSELFITDRVDHPEPLRFEERYRPAATRTVWRDDLAVWRDRPPSILDLDIEDKVFV